MTSKDTAKLRYTLNVDCHGGRLLSAEFHLSATPEEVNLWLSKRMPLQPSDEMLRARVELRAALKHLKPDPGHILSAEYFSIDDSFFDVENVLIYNIGTGTFRDASQNGLRFLRHRQRPAPTPSGSAFPYLHRYRLVPSPASLSEHTFHFEVPRLTSTLKPHNIWWHAADALCTTPVTINDKFSLHLEITTTTPVVNVAAVLKPLLDGVICALHSDIRPNKEVVQRLAAKCGWDPALVAQKLQEPKLPFLGDKCLIEPYRDYVKWAPDDHLCESCTVVVMRGTEARCKVDIRNHESKSA
ncbi:hypothetical protein DFR26_0523 [Paraperlucidibaca baekdonensis]|uniref:Uncharacterized protein n=1 Tax=Paraperlucidibaca baekdonensis TaxID=748120 RepID=A0A3E0H9L2_9GAMM|nr:hypothetical protein DFR26_0523 [Paraperlucidibaca baekdonensis]